MGSVYLAADTRLDRRVALKFLDPERFPADDTGLHKRVLHEARAASQLNHPNICHVYDVGGEGRESWIAMEYVEGDALSSIVRSRGSLSVDDTVRIGRQLAEALDHAHQRGILHRDLKSANVVCDGKGHATILDFGIARRLPQAVAAQVTRTETVETSPGTEGTLAYMAPEVILGLAQDERSDLWALGVVLFEMLSGELPFNGRNRFDLAAAIAEASPKPLPAAVPPRLTQVVTRLLAREPAARYGSAAEVVTALDRLSGASTAVSRRVTVRAPLAIATLTVVALAAAAWWWMRPDRALQLGDQRLIAASMGPRRAPSFSPDGQMVAYAAPDAGGVQQIWVQPLAAGAAIQITNGTSNASRPRWLARTNHILFAVAGQGLWTVSATGGTPTRLIERGTNPSVSRDGSRMVFEDRRLLWTAVSDGSNIEQVRGVTSPAYNLPMAPALSPDGSTIAYFSAAFGPNGDFWTVPAAGGTPVRLTNDLREGGWPVWTADGASIVASSARGGSRTLWQIPIDGREPSPLTTGAGEDDQPELAPDGRQLAYTNVKNSWDVRVRDLATGDERSLLQRNVELLFPTFSPDGTRIAYFGRLDRAVAIFTMNADGSDPRQLTAGRELNHMPRWSHDGQYVYFFQNAPTVSLRRVPALGGPSVEFKPWNWETTGQLYFNPTGQSLVFLRQRLPGAPSSVTEHTVIHDIATGRERLWAEPHTHPGGWSNDGAMFVGQQHGPGGGTRIVVCSVADEACRPVANGTTGKWSPRGDRIFFLRAQPNSGVQDVWSVAVDGTDERLLGTLGVFRAIDTFFDVSRNGLIVWAPFTAGSPELWTAAIK